MFHHITRAVALTAMTLAIAPSSVAQADEAEMTQEVLNHHLESFGAADVDAILSDYTVDSVIMLDGTKLTGPDEMRPLFEALTSEFGQEGVTFEMLHMQTSGRTAYLVWATDTPDNHYELATDTFLIEDGKIVAQTITAKVTPK